jgi:hypothetical protein
LNDGDIGDLLLVHHSMDRVVFSSGTVTGSLVSRIGFDEADRFVVHENSSSCLNELARAYGSLNSSRFRSG